MYDIQRKNFFNKFKANVIDLDNYVKIIVPIHVKDNHW